jgi:hypothetical protein
MLSHKSLVRVSSLLAFVGAASLPDSQAQTETSTGLRAVVQIASEPPRLLRTEHEALSDYERYKLTQLADFTSRAVLEGALARPEIAELALIKKQSDKVDWLRRNLEIVNVKDTELVQVALAPGSVAGTKDRAAIINAVANAYIAEVANVSLERRIARHDKLRKIRERYIETLKERRELVRKLSESAERQESRSELQEALDRLKAGRFQLDLDQAGSETVLARRKQVAVARSEAAKKEISDLEDRLAVISAQKKVYDEEIERARQEMKTAARHELMLNEKQREIDQMEDAARKVGAAIESLAVELEALPRARVVEPAN